VTNNLPDANNPAELRQAVLDHMHVGMTNHTLLAEEGGPLLMASAQGIYVTDIEGNTYIDGISGMYFRNAGHGRDVMKESIQEAASHVVHELERYLNTLGTIAAVTPLLGLLGTVVGMIKVFAEIMAQGTGNASVLAGGISEALITTATGLSVAIPALVMHRYFVGRIDGIVVGLEQETIKLVDAMHTEVIEETTDGSLQAAHQGDLEGMLS